MCHVSVFADGGVKLMFKPPYVVSATTVGAVLMVGAPDVAVPTVKVGVPARAVVLMVSPHVISTSATEYVTAALMVAS